MITKYLYQKMDSLF